MKLNQFFVAATLSLSLIGANAQAETDKAA